MKKQVLNLFKILLLLSAVVLGSCEKEKQVNDEELISSLTLQKNNTVYLQVGEGDSLKVEVLPAGLNIKLNWKSDNVGVATVNENGYLEAVGEGRATVSVSCGQYSDDCEVVVTPLHDIEYTVMMYGCAGGNLDEFIEKNMNEAARYGSTEKVKMTALVKFSEKNAQYPYTGFFDLQGNEFKISRYGDKKFDLSDPDHLAGFIKKSVELYPANNYVLVISNHGTQWDPRIDRPVSTKAMILDDNLGGKGMSIYALEEGVRRSGIHLELLYPDICLFGMLETMNQVKDITNYVLASSNLVPGSGGDYYHLMENLNSGKSTEELISDYMDDLLQFWKDFMEGYSPMPLDVKFLRPSDIEVVYPVVRKLRDRLVEILTSPDLVELRTQLFKTQNRFYFFDQVMPITKPDCNSVDILDALNRLNKSMKDPVIQECYEEMKAALEVLFIKDLDEYFSGRVLGDYGFSLGIQWNMKGNYVKKNFEVGYGPSIFNQATRWCEFLKINND